MDANNQLLCRTRTAKETRVTGTAVALLTPQMKTRITLENSLQLTRLKHLMKKPLLSTQMRMSLIKLTVKNINLSSIKIEVH